MISDCAQPDNRCDTQFSSCLKAPRAVDASHNTHTWEEVREDVYVCGNRTHVCGRDCEFMGEYRVCPLTGVELVYQRGDPRQLNLSGSSMERTVERVVHSLYVHPARARMHEEALRVIRGRHYGGSGVHALQSMRRDYCALTESYFPWVWTPKIPYELLTRITAQLVRLMSSKWLSSHRVNTEHYARSLLYVYMDGVVFRGLNVFLKQYELLSLFPPRREVDLRCVKLILSQIRTTSCATDLTRMSDMLDAPTDPRSQS